MKFLILFILLTSNVARAEKACFEREGHPRTHQMFASEADYQEELSYWQSKSPGTPNPYYLYRAYRVYEAEKKVASGMKSDKRAHCYMGCRIAQTTSLATADYVGWLKEDRDLKDCTPGTHYDEADYVATLRGAQMGASQADAKGCLEACAQVYK